MPVVIEICSVEAEHVATTVSIKYKVYFHVDPALIMPYISILYVPAWELLLEAQPITLVSGLNVMKFVNSAGAPVVTAIE